MPRSHNRRGRSRKGTRFIQLHHYLLKSPAWRSLRPTARAVYIELAMRFNGSNNGEIALSIRDAASKCNIAKDTARNALNELIQRGFIAVVTAGSFDFKMRHATEYRLTDFPCGKDMATKEFMSWLPENAEPGPNTGPGCPSFGTDTPRMHPNGG